MAEDEFVQFAEAVAPRLRRTAFLLCGDWHTAEDLAQTTLAKVFASWRRIRDGNAVSAYAMRTLLNSYLAEGRKKRLGELSPAGPRSDRSTRRRRNCGWRYWLRWTRCRRGHGLS